MYTAGKRSGQAPAPPHVSEGPAAEDHDLRLLRSVDLPGHLCACSRKRAARGQPEREERRKKASARQATMRAKRYFWFVAVVHPTDSSQGLENLNRIALVFLHITSMHPIL